MGYYTGVCVENSHLDTLQTLGPSAEEIPDFAT